jgi:putative aminopeptidase FrvX
MTMQQLDKILRQLSNTHGVSATMDRQYVHLGNNKITIVDAGGRGLIAAEQVIKWIKETAREYNINIQLDVANGGTTDATAIHLTRSGIPTAVINVPSRYIHSPVEVLDLEDLKAGAELLARSVETAARFF